MIGEKQMDFNIKALNWDNERRIKRAEIIANEIINAIPEKNNHYALDFGCGTGLVSFNLINNFEHITLVDSSEGMIKKLNEKIQDSKVKNMTAFQVDINNDSLLQEKSDVIYTSMVLHHIINTKMTLENLYKRLNNKGCLCIVDLDEDDGSFHKSEVGFDGHNGFN